MPSKSNHRKVKVQKPDLLLKEPDLLKDQKCVELKVGESGAFGLEERCKIQYSHTHTERKNGQNTETERITHREHLKGLQSYPNQS